MLVAFSITPLGGDDSGAPRVSLVLKADIRPGVTDALTTKVQRISDRLAGS